MAPISLSKSWILAMTFNSLSYLTLTAHSHFSITLSSYDSPLAPRIPTILHCTSRNLHWLFPCLECCSQISTWPILTCSSRYHRSNITKILSIFANLMFMYNKFSVWIPDLTLAYLFLNNIGSFPTHCVNGFYNANMVLIVSLSPC